VYVKLIFLTHFAVEWIKVDRGARLVYCESHATLGAARKREIQVKKWSRAKKEDSSQRLRAVEEFESQQIVASA
jgi:predicted GIY-YIG superfamily endonuclease